MYKNVSVLRSITSVLVVLLATWGVLTATEVFAATPAITTAVQVANVSGVNDQTAAVATPTPNVAQVQPVLTIRVDELPAGGDTLTIGTCVVTFAANADEGFNDDLTCAGGATIDLLDEATLRATSSVLEALSNLIGVSDAEHGALAISLATTTVSFTGTSTVATTTPIAVVNEDDAVVVVSNTNGVVPVAQVTTVTVGGTAEEYDEFTLHTGSFSATYEVPGDHEGNTDIAAQWRSAITLTDDMAIYHLQQQLTEQLLPSLRKSLELALWLPLVRRMLPRHKTLCSSLKML